MNKYIIEVPRGIRYISDWIEFYIDFPRFPHIMDKQIPGCGFTEFCLTNPDNTILCSPRNMLILNKWEQHPTDVFRVHNTDRDLDPEIDKELGTSDGGAKASPESEIQEAAMRIGMTGEEFLKKMKAEQEKADQNFTGRLARDLRDYFHSMDLLGKPYKILVTYDSFRNVKEAIKEIGDFSFLESFQVIVDEWQSIFIDSRFKSTTELEFVSQLQDLQKICYVSATPMIGSYMAQIPEFASLPYYELDWGGADPTRVMKPNLKVRVINSIYEPIKKIISEYLIGRYETLTTYNKETGTTTKIESKEAMIYVNSVKNIIQLVKKCGLKPDQVNILCANTPENLKKIQKGLGKTWTIGKVPLRDEPRKMFTLCTRTVYLGADFYSDNARSFILSDANIDSLAVDISLDLPQILGRQRLESNPWKNSAEFYYKPIKKDNKRYTKEMFEEEIAKKIKFSESIMANYSSAVDKGVYARMIRDRAMDRNYQDDYVAVNKHLGADMIPVMNTLVMIAEKRAFDIQQTDYADRFSVFSAIDSTFGVSDPVTAGEVKKILEILSEMTVAKDKLRFICETEMTEQTREIIESQLDEKMRSWLSLGRERLKELGYGVTQINAEFEKVNTPKNLSNEVWAEFNEGERLTTSEIKTRLKGIYARLNYNKTVKASDIKEWFEISSCRVGTKRIRGFELTKKKI